MLHNLQEYLNLPTCPLGYINSKYIGHLIKDVTKNIFVSIPSATAVCVMTKFQSNL